MCVVCAVDEAAKRRIIAHAAKFHEVTKSPFGSDDEIGMLNLIDGESRTAILSRADASKMFDLSVENFIGMPGWFGAGDQPYRKDEQKIHGALRAVGTNPTLLAPRGKSSESVPGARPARRPPQ